MRRYFVLLINIFLLVPNVRTHAAGYAWYAEGGDEPAIRIELTLRNTLDFDRKDCPVIISRDQMPMKDLNEMWVSVVDPELEPRPAPSKELLARQGGHLMRAEKNGYQLSRQLDDLDKDGVWDELFFMTDIGADETKTMYIYIGFSQRGWADHGTHAAIGSYCRHIIPFWESAHIGWKLWYPTDIDMFGKRKGVLMSNELYMKNLNGYGVEYDHGSDIQRVAGTFGAGGICLFENPDEPGTVSRPRFTMPADEKFSSSNFNDGQISDTRYAYDVVVNGPVRSIVRIKTMNWTSNGSYELEQYYTAYSNQNYSTCNVQYTTFLPVEEGTMFGCGIRKNASEYDNHIDDGIIITIGDDEISDPDDESGENTLHVDYVGNALVVKDKYQPEFRTVEFGGDNYTFGIPLTENLSYEYLIAGGWSEGEALNTTEDFKAYVVKTAEEYNNPLIIDFKGIEKRGE